MRRLITFAIVLSAISIFAIGCNPSGPGAASSTNALNNIPTDDYAIVMVVQPAEIYDSPFVKELLAELEEDKYEKGMVELEEMLGAKPEDVKTVAMTMKLSMADLMQGKPGAALMYGEGNFDTDKLGAQFQKMLMTGDLEPVSEDGRDYFTATVSTGETFGYGLIEGGYLGGSIAELKTAFALQNGEGESLAKSADFKEALALVENGSTFYMAIPSVGATLGPIAAMAGGMIQGEKEQELAAMVPAIKAAVVSATIGNTPNMFFRIRMGSAADAGVLAEYMNENIESSKQMLISGMATEGMSKNADPNDVIKNVLIKAKGDIVEAVVNFADAKAFIEADK